MEQSEVRKLCVHPTKFICSEDSIVSVFYKIKLNLLYYCCIVWIVGRLWLRGKSGRPPT